MAVELTVSLKGEDSSYKHKFLVYEEFIMQPDDPVIIDYIKQAKENAKFEIEDIKIRAMLQVQ